VFQTSTKPEIDSKYYLRFLDKADQSQPTQLKLILRKSLRRTIILWHRQAVSQ
jgi:hypothetical protein